MWTRAQLKSNAKAVLGQSYWKAFVVGLVLLFVSGGGTGGVSGSGSSSGSGTFSGNDAFLSDGILAWLIPLVIGGILVAGVIGIALSIMVFSPLEVGCRRFYLESTQNRFELRELGYAFTNKGYVNIVLTMLLRGVYTVLWFLCFIIPGIVKSYSYSMVPYILSENPMIAPSRAIEISKQMTRGHKLDMLVLDISFFGWILLGGLALGVGILFVNPYIHSTHAQLYLALRANALELGITSLYELTPPERY